MQTGTIKTKLLTALLTLFMVLSSVPFVTSAAEMDFLPEGVVYSMDNKHTYHTKANITANVSVKDSHGNVVETTQVSKVTNYFQEGGVSAVKFACINLQGDIEKPYKAMGTVTSENGSVDTTLDHFESADFYTFTPSSGDPIDFGSDLEEAKQYFHEHQDATGTFTKITDVHEYQIYKYTYDLNVQKDSRSESTITSADIENVKFNYQPGDVPQAMAWVSESDIDKYEIAYECWQQIENNNPVAAWYSDNGSHGSLPIITKFESGKSYVYSLMLKPKEGYSFSTATVITVNGQKVSAPFVGGSMYIPAVKTITIPALTVIDVVEINDVTVSFKDGDKPVFTGKVPDGANYAYRCEWWELDSRTGAMSTDFGNFYENKFTDFEAGKTYYYGVYVTVTYGDQYVFGPDTKLKINGEFVNYKRYEADTSDGSDGTMWVLTDLTMTPQASGTTPDYKIIDGANDSWTYNSDGTLKFVANGDFSKFTGLKVDGVLVKSDKYTAVSGSTVITMKKDYLSTLSVGRHTLTVVYDDGECNTEFEIKAARSGDEKTPVKPDEGNTATDIPTQGEPAQNIPESPKTGDNSNLMLWIALMFISGGAVIGTAVVNRRKKYNR